MTHLSKCGLVGASEAEGEIVRHEIELPWLSLRLQGTGDISPTAVSILEPACVRLFSWGVLTE